MNEDPPSLVCLECGKPFSPDTPTGLCPACQLAVAATQADDRAPCGPELATPQSRIQYLGDYVILGEIARGGMGVVYKARQESLNRVVAVKMILAGQLASEVEIRRFRTEAESAASLQHPNIVSIHEVGTHEGMQYFSMDWVDGPNLAEFIRRDRPDPREAARLGRMLAGAIQYAHQRGILHRDLKPQNVLMDAHGQPRITDFGLAKRMEAGDDAMTGTGSVMGSPSYMPPEQARGRSQEIGPASDVYSLGAILYHLLTGRAPFAGASALATLTMVVDSDPEAPRSILPDIPMDLETICLKCLEKSAGNRYATARALEEDLERFLNHEPIQARPARLGRKLWSWGRRNPWVLMLGLSLGLALAIGMVVLQKTEIGFLHYTALHPDYIRKPGAHLAPPWKDVVAFSLGVVICGLLVMGILFEGLKQIARLLVNRAGVSGPGLTQLASDLLYWRAGLVALGAGSLGLGVMTLRGAVDAHVWEGSSLWDAGLAVSWLYMSCLGFLGAATADADSLKARSTVNPGGYPLLTRSMLQQSRVLVAGLSFGLAALITARFSFGTELMPIASWFFGLVVIVFASFEAVARAEGRLSRSTARFHASYAACVWLPVILFGAPAKGGFAGLGVNLLAGLLGVVAAWAIQGWTFSRAGKP